MAARWPERQYLTQAVPQRALDVLLAEAIALERQVHVWPALMTMFGRMKDDLAAGDPLLHADSAQREHALGRERDDSACPG
jgi:hypothetical protein